MTANCATCAPPFTAATGPFSPASNRKRNGPITTRSREPIWKPSASSSGGNTSAAGQPLKKSNSLTRCSSRNPEPLYLLMRPGDPPPEPSPGELDKRHLWHPFTPMRDWCAPGHEPLVLVRGDGALLYDRDGREYLDGNSSIWTNIHGHNHLRINAALHDQIDRLAHSSSLGATNEPSARLAAALTALFPADTLGRVFYSDDGSTAIECALKMTIQYWQLTGRPEKSEFAAFSQAYHGDTLGAASLGGIDSFHERFSAFGVPTHRLSGLDDLDALPANTRGRLAAIAIEPLVQGAAGIRLWPSGMLRELRRYCDRHDIHLIVDEVMTGFGRTGTMFACEQEHVVPDFIALAKGLTAGYLPLAATLTTEKIFEAFLGNPEEHRTFYHGHSYFGNPLGCAAALASLEVFKEEKTLAHLPAKIAAMSRLLAGLAATNSHVRSVRQKGFIAGIDLGRNASTPFPPELQSGNRVCIAARAHGLLTRPIRDTIVLIPPLCTTTAQLEVAVTAIHRATLEVCSD